MLRVGKLHRRAYELGHHRRKTASSVYVSPTWAHVSLEKKGVINRANQDVFFTPGGSVKYFPAVGSVPMEEAFATLNVFR